MKKIFTLLFLCFCFYGCAGSLTAGLPESPVGVLRDQLAALPEEERQKDIEFDNRLNEIETQHINKSITEAEYLMLKNNLEQERNEYSIQMQQRADNLRGQINNILNSIY